MFNSRFQILYLRLGWAAWEIFTIFTQTDQFSTKQYDKSLCDSNIAQCVIPAKLVLDLIGERESTHPAHFPPGWRGQLDTCFRRYDKANRSV